MIWKSIFDETEQFVPVSRLISPLRSSFFWRIWPASPGKSCRAPRSCSKYGILIFAPEPILWMLWCDGCGPRWTIPSRPNWFTQFAASVMFSRRTEPRSIASQLVVLFTLAAALLLCCGLGAFYAILVRHASEEDNLFLKDKLLALHADLSTANWTKALNEELTVLRPGEHSAYWIRVIDSKGNTVAATPGMDAFLPSH